MNTWRHHSSKRSVATGGKMHTYEHIVGITSCQFEGFCAVLFLSLT